MPGYTLYDGPSLIDGAPVIAIAITSKSRNQKTGPMVQTYILRQDVSPVEANRTGLDHSICGNCPLKGTPHNLPGRKEAIGRACYVDLSKGPTVVYRAWQRGIYPNARGHDAIAAIGANRMVRLGAYGDPAAIPSYVWESLVSKATGHTAYSHQSDIPSADFRPDLYMQSADTLEQAESAWRQGNRTFRVVSDIRDMVRGREILCPASKEAGYRTTCADCRLCGGAAVRAKSIAIVAHGKGARLVGSVAP